MTYDIRHQYFGWLCDIVHVEQEEGFYYMLIRDLWRKPFISLVEHDENRAFDGLELRDEFLQEYGYSPDTRFGIGDCTVLEMMIGMARRMDFETTDPYDYDETSDKTSYWFWEMIDNLGLSSFNDESYMELDGWEYVDSIIDTFVERRYLSDGTGGLFPLKDPHEDQRKVELWYQMSAYLMENNAC